MSEHGDWEHAILMAEVREVYERGQERDADDLVERHGCWAVEMVPPVRYGEEWDDVEPDDDLERRVRDRARRRLAKLKGELELLRAERVELIRLARLRADIAAAARPPPVRRTATYPPSVDVYALDVARRP